MLTSLLCFKTVITIDVKSEESAFHENPNVNTPLKTKFDIKGSVYLTIMTAELS